jgi:hypothetical protein
LLAEGLGLGLVGAHPGDVDDAVARDGKVRSADRADGEGRSGVVVDGDRFTESEPAGGGVSVMNVGGLGVASEVDEVGDALGVERDLGLDASVGDTDSFHRGRGGEGCGRECEAEHGENALKRLYVHLPVLRR